MELRRLKQEVRNKHAVTVIWAYWQGTKVFPPSCSVLLSSCLVIAVHHVPSHSFNFPKSIEIFQGLSWKLDIVSLALFRSVAHV